MAEPQWILTIAAGLGEAGAERAVNERCKLRAMIFI
jgi:hypothetical protein